MKKEKRKESRAFKQAKSVMREADKYRDGKYTNLSTLTKISYITCALTLFVGLMEYSQWLQTVWFVIAALQFSTAISFFIKKGFLELIDAEYELKSNQILDPTWTTPVLKATSISQAGQD